MSAMNARRRFAVAGAVLCVAGFAQSALAANAPLAVRGPLSPVHPFPLWFQDASAAPGVKLEPCLAAAGCNLPATGVVGPFDAAAPITFPNNFPSAVVYGYANVDVPVFDQNSQKVLAKGLSYTAQLLATFGALGGNFDPTGAQVWTEISFVTTSGAGQFLPAGSPLCPAGICTYTITHPYGTFTLASDATGNLCLNRIQGGRNPCTIRFPAAIAAATPFDGVLTANTSADPNDATLGTFLHQVGAPAGFLGDGLTRSAITGSPVGQNFIRISGPGVGTSPGDACSNGVTTDCIEVGSAPPKGEGFIVAGKIFNAAGGATTQFWITDPLTATPIGTVPRVDFNGTAGGLLILTINAVDVNGNLSTTFNGTVSLASNDPLATVPLTATLVNGTATFPVTPHTSTGLAPTFTITATEITGGVPRSGTASGVVNPAPASALSVGALGPSVAGVPTSFGVFAMDPFGNVDTHFTTTVSVTSTDPQAVLPATFTLPGGTAIFSATFKTAGTFTLTADAGPSLTPGVTPVLVSPGPPTSIAAVSGGGQQGTAGSPLPAPFAVVVKDAFGNTVPGVPVTFAPPLGGSVSATVVATGADGQASSTGTLPTALGPYTYTASSGTLAGSPVSFGVTALHGPPASIAMTGPAITTAGVSTAVALALLDQFNNPCTTTSGSVAFTTSDAAPAPLLATITGGLGATAMTFHTAGPQTVSGVLLGSTASGSYAAAVNHAAASDLVLVSGDSQSFTVGLPLPQPLVVRVTDAFANPVPGAAVTFAAVTPGASVATAAAITAADGTAQTSATLASAVVGTQTFRATSGVLLGSPATFTATAAPAVPAAVLVTGLPGSVVAGSSAAFTVTVRDQFGNVSTGFNGGVTFASTDPAAALPAATTLVSGAGTFAVTFKTSGSRTVSATIATAPAITGTSPAAAVAPGPPASIAAVSGGGQTGTVGAPLAQPLVARVADAFGNPVPNAAVTFTGSAAPNPATTAADGTAAVTATSPTASGPANFVASVVGVTATASFAATAVPAAPATLTLSGVPASVTAGATFAVTVRAFDAFNNAATNFGGSVAFSSSDPGAVLPAATVFTAGATAALPVTLKGAGVRSVVATLSGSPAVTASAATAVVAAAPSTLAAASGGGQAGTVGAALAAPLVVTVTDSFGNPVSGVSVAFTAPATGSITSPVLTGASGQASAVGTLGHAPGAQSFTAAVAGLTPAQVSFGATANAGPVTALTVSGLPTSTTAGAPAGLTVTATDQFGNVATAFTGPVTFSSTDAAAQLPGASALTAGAGAFSATFRTAGARTLTVSSAVPALASTPAATTVAPAAPASITALSGSGQSGVVATALAAPFVARVQDTFGNLVPGVTVTFAAPAGASVSPLTATTTAAGTASATATLPSAAGAIAFTASTAGVATPLSFGATAVPDVPVAMTIAGLAASVTAGASTPLTLAVLDRFANPCTNFNGLIALTSTDAAAVLPAAPALAAGAGTFPLVFHTAGAQSVTAALAANSAVTASAATSVGAAAAASLALVSGNNQGGTVGAALAAPFVVRVNDAFGNPVAGTAVSFAAPATGSVAAAVATAANGQASATGTLGRSAGAQTFTASVTGLTGSPVSFAATASAGAAATLAAVSGAGQAGTVGVALGAPFVVSVTDTFGNPVSGAAVTFAAPATGAIAPSATTGANGQASATGTLGHVAGVQTFTASATGLAGSPAPFSVTASPAAAASIAAVSGGGQAGAVGTGLAAPFVVKVTDAFGNAVSGTTVIFTAPATGSVTAAAPTLADGTATASGTLGHAAGAQTFQASSGALAGSPVAFTATASPAAPAALTLSALPATVTAGVATPLSLAAFDAFGNACANFSGPLTLTSTDPAFAPPAASLTLGVGTVNVALVTAGPRSVTAKITTLPAAAATQGTTVVAGPASALALVSGTGQSATVGTVLAAPFVVAVADAFGNAVPGVAVAFTAPATGSIAATATTGASGQASATGTLGHAAGPQGFTATSGTLTGSPLTLTATGIPGAAASLTIAGLPASVPAGLTSTLTVTALDAFGNTASGTSGPVSVTSTDPVAVLPAAPSLAAGVAALPVAFKTTGARSITATIGGPISATASTTVTPAATGSIAVFSAPSSATVGTAASAASVIVKDTLGNVVPNATVTFSASSGASISPLTAATDAQGVATATPTVGTAAAAYTFTASVATFSATFSVTATPGAAASLAIGALAATTTAGAPAGFTVTASDSFGNTAAGFTGPVTFASSDPQAVLPASTALVGGVGSFSATFKTAGARTLTALSAAPAITSPAASTSVAPAAAASLALVSGSGQTGTVGAALGAPFVVGVKDAFGNAVAGVAVSFAAPATGSIAASVATAPSGQASATGTLGHTAGAQAFTASVAGLTGSPIAFAATASAGAAAVIAVGALPATVTAGAAASFTVTASDSFGNVATAFTGPVTFASTDARAVLPASSALVAGAGSFSATFKTAGSATLTASSASPALTSSAATISVAAAAAANLAAVSGGGQTGTVGVALASPFVVKVTDAFGNAVPGTAVTFTAPATGSVTLAAPTAADGTTLATGTLGHASGAQTFTASAVGVLATAPFSATASPGAPAALTMSALPIGVTAGVATPVSLAAFDAFGNACTSFNGALTFTSSDPAFSPPAASLVLGVGTANVTLVTAGSRTVTAVLTGTPSATATQSTTVAAGAASALALVSGTGQSGTVGTALAAPFVVSVTDAFGNAVSGAVVTFGAPATGSIPASATTGANGQASATGTLGHAAGPQAFTASSGALSTLSLGATAIAGAPATLTVTGMPAAVAAGTVIPLAVTALDSFGNTATGSNAPIAVTATDPLAVLPAAATLASGVASVPVRFKTTGTPSATLLVAGIPPVTVGTTVTPAATSSIAVVSAPPSATVGAAAGAASVVVKDTLGNVVPNATVTFTAPAGASISPPTAVTDAQGVAVATPTVGTAAAAYTFTAAVASFSTTFSVTALPGAGHHLALTTTPPPSTVLDCGCYDLVAQLEDSFGNAVSSPLGAVGATASASAAFSATADPAATTDLIANLQGPVASISGGALQPDGSAHLHVCDSLPEAATVTISAPSAVPAIAPASQDLTWTLGPVDAAKSSAPGNFSIDHPTLVAWSGLGHVSLRPVSACGNPIGAGQAVTFGLAGPGTLTPTAGAGSAYTTTLSVTPCPASGSTAVTARVGAVDMIALPVAITCVAPDAAQSTVSFTRQDVTMCDDVARDQVTVTVTPRDVNGALLGPGNTLAVAMAGLSGGAARDVGDGSYTATFTASACDPAAHPVTVTVDGVDIASAPLTFSCSPVVAGSSGVGVNGKAVADGASKIKVTVASVNSCGEQAKGRAVVLSSTLGTLAATSGTTNDAGTFETSLTATAAGQGTISATVDGVALAPASVTFDPKPKGGGCGTGGVEGGLFALVGLVAAIARRCRG